jgi:hypothetical protein
VKRRTPRFADWAFTHSICHAERDALLLGAGSKHLYTRVFVVVENLRLVIRRGGLLAQDDWGVFGELNNLRHAKIQDLRHVLFSDEDVGWLDVAMDDVLFVRGLESRSDLDRDLQPFRLCQREAACGNLITQSTAL